MGLGLGLMFIPCISVPAHYFRRRIAFAVGIILSGSSLGSIAFPISKHITHPSEQTSDSSDSAEVRYSLTQILKFLHHPSSQLIPRIGFGQSVRATAYIVLGLSGIGCALMRARYPLHQERRTVDMKAIITDIPYWGLVLS